jgi:CHAT domain-containing protein
VAATVDDAIKHFREALRWRSFARNPSDWAYTEINFGLAFFKRPGGDRRTNLRLALDHYRNAARGFEASGEIQHLAQALHNVSAAEFDLLQLDASATGRGERLDDAVAVAEASLVARPASIAPIEAGRTWKHLGQVHEVAGSVDAAITAYRRALETLTPSTAPRECRDAARSLAQLVSERDGASAAAASWETAAEAAAQAADLCVTAKGRFKELHAHSDVFRLAGYALASSGRLERAAEIIELGRARELSAWIRDDVVDESALHALNPRLCEEFLSLRRRLDELGRVGTSASLGGHESEAAEISERLDDTIGAIRSLPGFDRFLSQPKFREIVGALHPDEALAYLATSPDGCATLLVSAARDGPSIEAAIVDEPTSGQIVRIVVDVDEQSGAVLGYAWAQHAGDASELNQTLADLGEALGPNVLRPLAETLRRRGLRRVCLVPAGLLGLLPLHALAWDDSSGGRCLLDDVEVTYAPSAAIHAICRTRAETRADEPRRLLAVGNPFPQNVPLPGAEREARMVAHLFGETHVCLLVESEATKDAVLASLPQTTHVHLACHGAADWPDDVLSAKLVMAHEVSITADEILTLEDFAPRLVVASACQTGVIQGYETVDQALSLATVFLGAGAADVVATLWPVRDDATALLMSRFYEALLRDLASPETDLRPSAALREAQLWLRDLTAEDENRYLQQRPELRALRDLLREQGGTQRGSISVALPYRAISDWAPYLTYGA